MAIVIDTNILMNNPEILLNGIEEELIISSIVIEETDHLKESNDNQKAFKARRGTRWLKKNEDRYKFVLNDVIKSEQLINGEFDLSKNDNKILDVCLREKAKIMSLDFNVVLKAKALGIEIVESKPIDYKEYKGYIEKQLTDEELANFYQYGLHKNIYDLLLNEYLIIKDSNGYTVDSYKWNGEELVQTDVKNMKSMLLGVLKPLDRYQMCVLDSFQSNQITMVKGKAGSGKSYLSMGYLFHQLEKGRIEKIIIFTNPVATRNAAKLGFYPGTKNEKLLDSSIGNFLSSKLGDIMAIEMLLQQNKLVLLPLSDIRGYDTSNMKAGIYITEAQNTSIDLMKLALQRIGEDCTCIIDGDYNTQVDDVNFENGNNGMKRMSEVFKGQSIYGEVELDKIYRSKIANIANEM